MKSRRRHNLSVRILLLIFALWPLAARTQTVGEATEKFLSGDYSGCISMAQKAAQEHPDDEDWQVLLSEALLTVGQYPEAYKAITNALALNTRSIRLRWQAREVLLQNGQAEAAATTLSDMLQMAAGRPWAYRDAASLVVLGQAALLGGADPKRVLNKILEPAIKAEPKSRDAYLACGRLALDKHDFALAAKKFEQGLKELPDDPDLHCGLAEAYAPSDHAAMVAAAEAALAHNSNHIGCLLLLADHAIDAEDYAEAENILTRVQAINPWQPDSWAYSAVIAHLRSQPEKEESARQSALKFWPANPRVDFLIGRKLSQNYRFTEGAARQRQALKFDPDYLPAKAQLAQDLLRLGEEAEGWKLAEAVQKQDEYDVEAYNLSNLHQTMQKFVTLTNADFLVRMGAHEGKVYGDRVLELLSTARSNLCAKYEFQIQRPTIVEIFPEQKDFAVRTFGMPGNPGYLGVCFGSVVTANSPASQSAHPVNWEAVLWHEFCHVVTLQMTKNKMPRWLSEGISVYEEMQANPAWGQHMDPRYREMVLDGELTAVSELSGAFLSPRSDLHLQFAYYESSLVVEFLVSRFGLDHLKAILSDLGQGVDIKQAIQKHSMPMDQLEQQFSAFAEERARNLAPALDFTKPEFAKEETGRRPRRSTLVDRYALADWDSWSEAHPTNFWALTQQAQKFVAAEQWADAKPILEKLITMYPDFTGQDSSYKLLAATHRALGDTNAERAVLARFVQKDDAAPEACLRLMELGDATHDWPAVAQNADRYLQINPLVPPPYRFLSRASEKTGATNEAIQAYGALLALAPPDPAEIHFHLAQLLRAKDELAARRHLLQALEEAPRYREALQLLLQITQKPNASSSPASGETQ